MLALPLFLTSCDDILGEWSKPTPTIITPETPVKVTSITLNKTSTSLPIGATETLTVETVAPDNATDKSVTWSSDNTAAATVDDNGLVTAVAIGTAIITATAKDGSGVTATCTVVVGLLTGKFTINAGGDQIQFAQGNLQAVCTSADGDASTQETWTWGFAANQWDYIGVTSSNFVMNGNGSVSTAGTVDLYGWSTALSYFGIQNHGGNDLFAGDDFVDWGANIGTGWYTLSKDEWVYLFNTRTTPSGLRFVKAKVNNVNGVILLPDDWDVSNYALSTTASYTANVITLVDWTEKFESNGAVFLPITGDWGNGNGDYGSYWSSNKDGATSAFRVRLDDTDLDPSSTGERNQGYAVRLVYPAQ